MSDATNTRRFWLVRLLTSLNLVGLALVLLLAAASRVDCYEEHFEVNKKQVTLEEVCSNAQVPIISVHEFERLFKDLLKDDTFSICIAGYRQAITQLEPIVLNQDHAVCSDEKFELIKKYHFQFINPRQETYKFGDDLAHLDKKIVYRQLDENPLEYGVQLDERDKEVRCPIAVQQFFKAYVLQVSGLCKMSLIANVQEAMRSLDDDDYKLFSLIKYNTNANEKSPVRESAQGGKSVQKLEPNKGLQASPLIDLANKLHKFKYGLPFRELVYMPELEGELEEGDLQRSQEVVVLDLRERPELNNFMRACDRRFRPIYSKLIMPIVRLAKLGYDYVGRELDRHGDQLQADDVMTWRLVTLICESNGKIQLVGDEDVAEGDEEEEAESGRPKMRRITFNPVNNRRIDGALWIKGAEQLAEEFRNSNAHQLHGLQKFLHDSSVAGRKFVAAVDPQRFRFYRRNQNTISNFLNTFSIITTWISIVQTLAPKGR